MMFEIARTIAAKYGSISPLILLTLAQRHWKVLNIISHNDTSRLMGLYSQCNRAIYTLKNSYFRAEITIMRKLGNILRPNRCDCS